MPTGDADARAISVNLGANNDVTVTGTVTSTPSGTQNVDVTANTIGLATSANQLADGHNVTVDNSTGGSAVNIQDGGNTITVDGDVGVTGTVTANAGTNLNTSALALQTSQGQWRGAVSGLSNFKEVDGKPRFSSTPYGYDVGEGNIVGHTPFLKIGYNPVVTDVEETIWSKGGTYAFLKGESTLQIVSDDNTQDIASQLFNSTSTGGSTTTLEDSGVDFTAGANPVAVFDCVILDKSSATPEWGYVTAVATTTLTIAGGFSSGGTGDARDYIVLNRTAYTGAQAVHIQYLDGDFVEHEEIVLLNGTTAVNTVNSDYYRVNHMDIIAAGTLAHCLGNLSLKDVGSAPVYAYITAGFTTARQSIYTVPAGKTLYLLSWKFAWCSPDEIKVQSARGIIRVNMDAFTSFNTNDLFFPYAEVMATNENVSIDSDVPFRVPEKMDITASAISTNAAGSGPCTSALRGWLEEN